MKLLEQGFEAWNAWRGKSPQELPDLTMASLKNKNLRHFNFSNAKFSRADLSHVNFGLADLDGADLTGCNLTGTNLSACSLQRTILEQCRLWGTRFCNVDLSQVVGLATVTHRGPSTIGMDSLYRSEGQIPVGFLRDAGVPEDVIESFLPLVRDGYPIQWHSCFISYATRDEDFARRLYSRMRSAKLRVWYATEDLKGGELLVDQLFKAIQLHDKLLLILSQHSVHSEWVKTEIRKAREVETNEKRRKLFPIRLVNFETLRDWSCLDPDTGKDLAREIREYAMPNDFSNWSDDKAFEAAFQRLLRDLRA